ncbi:MAG: rRNA cytosine-C5-methyltransferase, partial [Muribaculaceae bacterium]|nr:rRNA cytosine-C5-methyltransferase [Muribaculaceae bacterium]
EAASRAILTPPMSSGRESLMRPDLDMQLHLNDSLVSALPAAAEPILALLLRANVRVTGAGLPVGELKGADAIPDSRLPLSLAMRPEAFPRVELSMEDALRYLRREAIPLPADTPKGYVTVCYRSLPLGLMKNLGNRANNLFPAPWRIKI